MEQDDTWTVTRAIYPAVQCGSSLNTFNYTGYKKKKKSNSKINRELYTAKGRDSSVGIATRYRLDGPGIESRWGGEFFRTRPDPPSLLYNGYRVFPGGKAAGTWLWPPTPNLAPRLRKEQSYCSTPPSGPSWGVIGWALTLLLRFIQTYQRSSSAWKGISLVYLIRLLMVTKVKIFTSHTIQNNVLQTTPK